MSRPDSGAVSVHFRIRPRLHFSATLTLYGRGTLWGQWALRYPRTNAARNAK
jgi:hypothetical protein